MYRHFAQLGLKMYGYLCIFSSSISLSKCCFITSKWSQDELLLEGVKLPRQICIKARELLACA